MKARMHPILGMGQRVGGEDSSNKEVLAIAREIFDIINAERREPVDGDLSIDLVFDTSGPLYDFEYASPRTGKLWRKDRVLQVQVAVPTGLSRSQVWSFFEEIIAKVFDLADAYNSDHRLGYSVDALRQVVKKVQQDIRSKQGLEKTSL